VHAWVGILGQPHYRSRGEGHRAMLEGGDWRLSMCEGLAKGDGDVVFALKQ
jgi:hypothetical protein